MTRRADAPLEVLVLGATEVRQGGRGIALGKPQVVRVLTALALRHPAPSSAGALQELVWPGRRKPQRPEHAIYTYVSNLRSALRQATGEDDWVVSSRAGYGLEETRVQLDRDVFDHEVEAAWAAAEGAPSRAIDSFDRALARWRGPPFAAIDDAPGVLAEVGRLDAQRLGAIETRARLKLDAGAGSELLATLETAAEEHPLHERIVTSLAIALYRSGRQSEALGRLRALTGRLRDELGVDPAPETASVELAILHHDVSLTAPPTARPRSDGTDRGRPPLVDRFEQQPFLGRDREMDELGAWWRSSAPIACIAGEPGIGKSRLAAHLVATTVPPTTPVAWVTASRIGGGAIVGLAAAILDLAGADEVGTVDPAQRDVLRFVETGDVGETAYAGTVTSHTRRAVLRGVLLDLCTSAASRHGGLVVVVDDLQWVDATTLELLDLVAGQAPDGVRVVVTQRTSHGAPAALDVALVRWRRTGAAVWVEPSGLSEHDVALLVADLVADPPADLAARLAADTGGNPFYLASLLHHLAEGHDDTLPTDLVALVGSQLDSLAPPDQGVLHIASALGHTFSAPLLAVAAERPVDEIGAVIDRAVAAGLLAERADGSECWVHAITREAVYSGLGPRRRIELHRAIAERLERGYADDIESVLLALARHALIGCRGASPRQAVRLALRAAQFAMSCTLYEQAGSLAAEARGLLTNPTDELGPALYLLEMEALLDAGRHDRLSDLLEEAWSSFVTVGTPRQLAEMVSYLDLFDYRAATAERILGVLPLVESDDEAHVRVLSAAAISLSVADPERAMAILGHAWELAAPVELLGLPTRLELLEGRLLTRWARDSVETRRTVAADYSRLAAGSRSLEISAGASMWERIVGYESGDLALVDEASRRQQRLAEQLQLPIYQAGARQRAAARLVLEGRFAEAERTAASVLEVSSHDAFVAGYAAQLLAIRIEQARLLDLADLFDGHSQGLGGEGPWRATQALVRATQGRVDEALADVDAMLGDGSAARPNLYLLTTLGLLSLTTVITRDPTHARLLRAHLAPHAGRVVVVSTAAAVWGAVARFVAPLDLLLGDVDGALEHATLALSIHERLGARPYIARDRLLIASALARRAGAGDLDRAGGLAREVLRLAQHLGMPAVAEEALALVVRLGLTSDGDVAGKVSESRPS